MDLVNKFKRIISLLISKRTRFYEIGLIFLLLIHTPCYQISWKLELHIGNRSGLILIRSGGFYVNPGPSNPSSKGKFAQIWAAGADGLKRKFDFKQKMCLGHQSISSLSFVICFREIENCEIFDYRAFDFFEFWEYVCFYKTSSFNLW